MIKSFIYPEIDDTTRNYGGIDPIINPSGDWTSYLTPFEEQNVAGVESSACYVEAQQSCIATLLEKLYGIKDSNFSARFNALLSGGTEMGGDPIKGALSIKKDGLIPQSMMDWTGVNSWDYFHSWKGVDKNKCITEGKRFVSEWDMSFTVIVEKDAPLETKYAMLRYGLLRSPVPLSFYAWLEKDGYYYKPKGVRDTHLISGICIKVNPDNSIVVKDTYSPHIKTLEPNADFEFAMYWTIKKKDPNAINKSFLEILKGMVKLLQDFYEYTKKTAGAIVSGIFSKTN